MSINSIKNKTFLDYDFFLIIEPKSLYDGKAAAFFL